MLLDILIFLLILGVAVVIHELAHYFNAKQVGLPIRAFSVGMGPVLLKKQWRGTEWRLSALPLGGYVDIPGMAPEAGPDGVLRYPDGGFHSKGLLAKLWVLIGGVIANYLLALVLLGSVIYASDLYRTIVLTNTSPVAEGAIISDVLPESAGEQLGLQGGDDIQSINGITDPTPADVINTVQTADNLSLVLKRSSETVEVNTPWPLPSMQVTPEEPALLGIRIGPKNVIYSERISFLESLGASTTFMNSVIPQSVQGFVRAIGQTFQGKQSDDIAGPVRIVGLVGDARQSGLASVLFMAALINFSLAIFNLLPIPGLDGGRIFLAFVNSGVRLVTGRPLPPGREEVLHLLGFAFLMTFMVMVIVIEVLSVVNSS